MNLSELLQGVLSGKFAVPQGALSTPYSDAANVRDLSRQNIAMKGQQPPIMSSGPMSGVLQPAPPPGGGPPLGPGLPPQGPPQGALAPSAGPGRDPGMNGAPAPTGGPGIPQSAQVGAPPPLGYGRAPDSIGNGRPPMGPGWNPRLDPNQPQASPQPGNGVLADNNAAGMAQALRPMALQSTDESTPTPAEKPGGVLASIAPDTAKEPAKSDPVTRAKGILAAATSGDPGAFQAALTSPSAAAQVGSQTPDSAWNERSSYDGQAVSPTTPDGKPKPLSDQHAEDKQRTFGQKFMGALADPDTQDLLQSIGIGLLSNPNAMKGMAAGMQMYQQLHLRREDRNQKFQEFQAEQKTRQQTADTQALSVQQTGAFQKGELESQKADQDIRRTDAENIARYRAQQLQQSASELGETRRYHDIEAGGQAATRAIERDRMRLEMEQPTSSQTLPIRKPDGSWGAVTVNHYRGGRQEMVPLPDGVQAGVGMGSGEVNADVKGEADLQTRAVNALGILDDTSKVDNILAKEPGKIGPDLYNSAMRWAAVKLGLGDGDPTQELRQLKAKSQIEQQSALKNVRGSDYQRRVINEMVSNVDTMSPGLLKNVNDAMRQDALSDIQAADGYLRSRPDRAASPGWAPYNSRRTNMDTQGGVRSGVGTSGNSVGGGSIQTTPEEDALITKHLK